MVVKTRRRQRAGVSLRGDLCYDSWSLSHLGYLYPGTTPVMIKLSNYHGSQDDLICFSPLGYPWKAHRAEPYSNFENCSILKARQLYPGDASWQQVVFVGGSILGCSWCLRVTWIRMSQCKSAVWQRLASVAQPVVL